MRTKIHSLQRLVDLARAGKSVLTWTGVRMPAAFIVNMQGMTLYRWMENGLYEYVPRRKK